MKFARFGESTREIPAIIAGEQAYDLREITADIDSEFFSSDGIKRAAKALSEGVLPRLDTSDLRIAAPIARPSAVVCVGMNYAAHAAESGSEPPEVPIIFLKTPNTVVGPNDRVAIPRNSEQTDWEVELGVVIGKRVSYLQSPGEALEHVAGFVVANDLSEREFQLEVSGGQWSKGKCAAGFNPTGPWLVTPDEINHNDLRLRSWVNGEIRQDSSTADMIFDVETIIWHLSQYLVLEPGDLLLTGTPEGVALSGRFPYLKVGDIVEIEIEGLGKQRQEFTQA